MSTSVIADLVRRTSLICGLAVALDADAFLEFLRRAAPQADLRTAAITRVGLRAPDYCRVGYQVEVSGEMLDLDVRAGQEKDVAEWRSAGRSEAVPGPLGPGRIVIEDQAILIHVFPNDPKLPEVRHLADGSEREPVLRELFPAPSDLWRSEFRPLRYRPERRFVAELRGEDGERALLKSCTKRAYPRSKHNATAFRTDGPLRIAGLLGSTDRRHLLAYEWLSGRPLSKLFADPEVDRRSLTAAGAALATMHHQRPEGLSDWTRDSQVAHLESVAAEIGFVSPRLASRAQAVARRLQEHLPEAVAMPVAIHGDISASHLLVDGGSVGIIDLDWACYGDPADDLGYLIAHVERLAARGKVPPGRVDCVREALLEGYGGVNDPDFNERVDLYTAVGLLQQTRFPFRSWAPDWPEGTEALLARTEAYANGLS